MNIGKKIALVTGSNRGIGFEVCRQLAQRRDLQVILASRDEDKGIKACRRLQEQGLKTDFVQLDVTSDSSCDVAVKQVTQRFGRLDILVNNAGIMNDAWRQAGREHNPSILTTSLDVIRQALETNTFGAIRMSQRSVPLMLKNRYGRIVNISSGMAQLSEMNGGWPGYRISKTALNAVTRILSDELSGTGILVNSVCPGWVKTDMGGPHAELPVEEGADTVVWLATLPDDGPTGGFFRERKPISW